MARKRSRCTQTDNERSANTPTADPQLPNVRPLYLDALDFAPLLEATENLWTRRQIGWQEATHPEDLMNNESNPMMYTVLDHNLKLCGCLARLGIGHRGEWATGWMYQDTGRDRSERLKILMHIIDNDHLLYEEKGMVGQLSIAVDLLCSSQGRSGRWNAGRLEAVFQSCRASESKRLSDYPGLDRQA